MSGSLANPVSRIDRNLLLGVLAVEEKLIDSRKLAEACFALAARPQATLTDLLVETGCITLPDVGRLNDLVEQRLASGSHAPSASTMTQAYNPDASPAADAADASSVPAATTAATGKSAQTRIEAPADPLGATRDRYALTGLHATGGLGRVWLARDEELDRTVALKELKPDTAHNPSLAARFLHEARITGQLEHPGIVPVYELCRRPGHAPFYVMRFIRGRTLREAIKEYHVRLAARLATPLELRAILSAFVSVCQAVGYAHSREVIHRDLKGQNVVLGDFGEVIVLDWGLAKFMGSKEDGAADADAAHRDALADAAEADRSEGEFTEQGQAVGTPAYMSPEQAAGRLEQVNQRSDVYSLGAILFDILAGRAPFHGKRSQDVLAQVQREEPAPPRQWCSSAPPALEAVCLKALAKRQEQRYGSALELAREVQRWLADEPVEAYPEPAAQRAARWARKHKVLVAGLGSLAATLLLSAVTFLLIANQLVGQEQARTEAALDRAETNFAQAQEQRARAERNFTSAEEQRGKAEQNFRAAESQRIEAEKNRKRAVAEQHRAEKNFALAEEQRQRADVNYSLARDAVKRYFTTVSDSKLLKVPGMEGLRKNLLESAREFYEKFIKERQDDPVLRGDLAEAYFRLATITGEIGSKTEAIGQFERALDLYQDLGSRQPDRPQHRVMTARTLNNLGRLYQNTGQGQKAQTAFNDCIKLRRALLEKMDSIDIERDLAGTYLNLSLLEQDGGRLTRALELCEQARPTLQAIAEGPQSTAADRMALASCYNNVGLYYQRLGKLAEARQSYGKALALRKPIVDEYPEDGDFCAELCSSYHNLAYSSLQIGQPDKAIGLYREQIQLCEELQRKHPAVTAHRVNLGMALNNLGMAYLDLRNLAQATEVLRRGLDLRLELARRHADIPDFQRDVGYTYTNLAQSLQKQGQLAQAEEALLKAIAISTRLTADHPDVQEYQAYHTGCHNNLSFLYRDMGQLKKAETHQLQALHLRKKLLADHGDIAEVQRDLVLSYINLGNLYQASSQSAKSIEVLEKAIGLGKDLCNKAPDVPLYRSELSSGWNNLCLALLQTGQMKKALDAQHEALSIRRQLVKDFPDMPEYQRDLALSHHNLAMVLRSQTEREQAVKEIEQAVALWKNLVKTCPEVHLYRSELTGSYNNLALELTELAQLGRAEKLHLEALKIRRQLVLDCPGDAECQRNVALSCNNLGMTCQRMGAFPRAEKLFLESADLYQKLVEACPDVPLYRSEGTGSRSNLAGLYNEMARLDRAEKLLLALLPERGQLAKRFPDVPEYRRDVAITHGHLGTTFKALRKPREADAHFKQCIAGYQALVKDYPDSALYLNELTYGFNNLGNLCTELFQFDRAEKLHGDALEIRKKLILQQPGNPEYRHNLALSHVNLSGVYRMSGRPMLAEPLLLKGMALTEKLAADYPGVLTYQQEVAAGYGDVGQFYRFFGKPQQAITWFDRSIAGLTPLLKADESRAEVRRYLVNAHWWKGETLQAVNKHAEAIKVFDTALAADRGQSRYGLQAVRACSLAHVGHYRKAVAETTAAIAHDDVPADALYNFACALSLSLTALHKDDSVNPPDREKLFEQWAVKAVDTLERCCNTGYFKNQSPYENMKQDTDLQPLRARQDFKRFLENVEKTRR